MQNNLKKDSTTTNKLFEKALQHHHMGELHEAEILYSQILRLDPSHSDALHMFIVLAYQLGKLDISAKLIDKALSMNSKEPSYQSNLGLVLTALGRTEEAVLCYRRAIEMCPDFAEAYNNLGHALISLEKVEEAMECFRLAIDVCPDFAEAHNNLGFALYAMGNSIEAIEHYQQAIEIKPGFAEAYNNLGNALSIIGKQEEAIACYEQAIEINPNYIEAFQNLGAGFLKIGMPEKAISCYQNLVHIEPHNLFYWQALSNAYKACTDYRLDKSYMEDIERCLSIPNIEKTGAGKAAQNLLLKMKDIQSLLTLFLEEHIDTLTEQIYNSPFRILRHPLLLLLLKNSIVTSPVLESLLTRVRRIILKQVVNKHLTISLIENWFEFTCALAHQVFMNEYVFFQDQEEQELVKKLLKQVEDHLNVPNVTTQFLIVLLATYMPLYCLKSAHKLLRLVKSENSESFNKLIKLQLQEPLEEISIRKEIPVLTKIKDPVSKAVCCQYEENPYPRWQNAQYLIPLPLDMRLKQLFPYVHSSKLSVPKKPAILIAGCGTGKHAIECARAYLGANILAIDLSLTSLAYGIRKAREQGVFNIEFAQADILELQNLGRKFDVIECVGVLHHLHNPIEGFRILVDVLKDRGLMLIGLYSKIARQYLIETRSFINKRGYEPSEKGIRQCRQDIFSLPDDMFIKRCISLKDFYTTSECRDLLFHVQEHCFTLPQLADMLQQFGLEFLGFQFEDMSVIHKYRLLFPKDIGASSLANWHKYELDNPDTFLSMYQFWVRKKHI